MKIRVNGSWLDLPDSGADAGSPAAGVTLAALLPQLGFGDATVATAVNGQFVPHAVRSGCLVREGDRIEILAPMQGG